MGDNSLNYCSTNEDKFGLYTSSVEEIPPKNVYIKNVHYLTDKKRLIMVKTKNSIISDTKMVFESLEFLDEDKVDLEECQVPQASQKESVSQEPPQKKSKIFEEELVETISLDDFLVADGNHPKNKAIRMLVLGHFLLADRREVSPSYYKEIITIIM